MAKWLAIFTLIPLAETFLLYVLGQHMGFFATVGVILLTGVLGAALAKREGLKVWREWTESLRQGKLPEEGIVGGLLVLVGGVLLVTPGVLTDVTGVLLLVPPSRRFIGKYVRKYAEKKLQGGSKSVRYRVDVGPGGFKEGYETSFGFGGRSRDPNVIDAEGEVVEERRRGDKGVLGD